MTYKVLNGGYCRARDVMRSLERNCSSVRSFHLRVRASVMRRLSREHLWQNAIPLEDGDQEPRYKQLGFSLWLKFRMVDCLSLYSRLLIRRCRNCSESSVILTSVVQPRRGERDALCFIDL